jgi:hypothetical protein
MDGALDHDTFDDDTLTHHITQIANPGSAKTLTGAVANASQNAEDGPRGFEGPSMQDILRRPTGSVAVQEAQASQSTT